MSMKFVFFSMVPFFLREAGKNRPCPMSWLQCFCVLVGRLTVLTRGYGVTLGGTEGCEVSEFNPNAS